MRAARTPRPFDRPDAKFTKYLLASGSLRTGTSDVTHAERSDAPLSNADLYVELAKLTLMIMRIPEGVDTAAQDEVHRLVAQFESRASELLGRAALASREYAERRIAELVQSSPVYQLLGEDAARRVGYAVVPAEADTSANDRLPGLRLASSGAGAL